MYAKRRPAARKPRRAPRKVSKPARKPAAAPINTASVRENYTMSIPDGSLNFFSSVELADGQYNRSQAVAQAYQEFKIKYIKLTFRPSADTFPVVAGNTIPQLYFQLNKANAIPTNANLQTLLDMGCRPIRFDDKNIVKTYLPTVLTADMTGAAVTSAAQVRTAPWLSTNALSGSGGGAAWTPSTVDHLGCVFQVTKMSALTPTDNYSVDVEVVFLFRKPLWRAGAEGEITTNNRISNGVAVPIA